MLAGVSLLVAASVLAAPRQLFLDESSIESSSGTRLRMHPAVIDDSAPKLLPGGPGGGPWEGGRIIGYNSVVDNGTHVLLYYDAFSVNGPVKDDIARCTCLAISAD
eukprot:COSAG03_NODE_9395_length_723_cov_0.929487_1_plen_105_part_10